MENTLSSELINSLITTLQGVALEPSILPEGYLTIEEFHDSIIRDLGNIYGESEIKKILLWNPKNGPEPKGRSRLMEDLLNLREFLIDKKYEPIKVEDAKIAHIKEVTESYERALTHRVTAELESGILTHQEKIRQELCGILNQLRTPSSKAFGESDTLVITTARQLESVSEDGTTSLAPKNLAFFAQKILSEHATDNGNSLSPRSAINLLPPLINALSGVPEIAQIRASILSLVKSDPSTPNTPAMESFAAKMTGATITGLLTSPSEAKLLIESEAAQANLELAIESNSVGTPQNLQHLANIVSTAASGENRTTLVTDLESAGVTPSTARSIASEVESSTITLGTAEELFRSINHKSPVPVDNFPNFSSLPDEPFDTSRVNRILNLTWQLAPEAVDTLSTPVGLAILTSSGSLDETGLSLTPANQVQIATILAGSGDRETVKTRLTELISNIASNTGVLVDSTSAANRLMLGVEAGVKNLNSPIPPQLTENQALECAKILTSEKVTDTKTAVSQLSTYLKTIGQDPAQAEFFISSAQTRVAGKQFILEDVATAIHQASANTQTGSTIKTALASSLASIGVNPNSPETKTALDQIQSAITLGKSVSEVRHQAADLLASVVSKSTPPPTSTTNTATIVNHIIDIAAPGINPSPSSLIRSVLESTLSASGVDIKNPEIKDHLDNVAVLSKSSSVTKVREYINNSLTPAATKSLGLTNSPQLITSLNQSLDTVSDTLKPSAPSERLLNRVTATIAVHGLSNQPEFKEHLARVSDMTQRGASSEEIVGYVKSTIAPSIKRSVGNNTSSAALDSLDQAVSVIDPKTKASPSFQIRTAVAASLVSVGIDLKNPQISDHLDNLEKLSTSASAADVRKYVNEKIVPQATKILKVESSPQLITAVNQGLDTVSDSLRPSTTSERLVNRISATLVQKGLSDQPEFKEHLARVSDMVQKGVSFAEIKAYADSSLVPSLRKSLGNSPTSSVVISSVQAAIDVSAPDLQTSPITSLKNSLIEKAKELKLDTTKGPLKDHLDNLEILAKKGTPLVTAVNYTNEKVLPAIIKASGAESSTAQTSLNQIVQSVVAQTIAPSNLVLAQSTAAKEAANIIGIAYNLKPQEIAQAHSTIEFILSTQGQKASPEKFVSALTAVGFSPEIATSLGKASNNAVDQIIKPSTTPLNSPLRSAVAVATAQVLNQSPTQSQIEQIHTVLNAKVSKEDTVKAVAQVIQANNLSTSTDRNQILNQATKIVESSTAGAAVISQISTLTSSAIPLRDRLLVATKSAGLASGLQLDDKSISAVVSLLEKSGINKASTAEIAKLVGPSAEKLNLSPEAATIRLITNVSVHLSSTSSVPVSQQITGVISLVSQNSGLNLSATDFQAVHSILTSKTTDLKQVKSSLVEKLSPYAKSAGVNPEVLAGNLMSASLTAVAPPSPFTKDQLNKIVTAAQNTSSLAGNLASQTSLLAQDIRKTTNLSAEASRLYAAQIISVQSKSTLSPEIATEIVRKHLTGRGFSPDTNALSELVSGKRTYSNDEKLSIMISNYLGLRGDLSKYLATSAEEFNSFKSQLPNLPNSSLQHADRQLIKDWLTSKLSVNSNPKDAITINLALANLDKLSDTKLSALAGGFNRFAPTPKTPRMEPEVLKHLVSRYDSLPPSSRTALHNLLNLEHTNTLKVALGGHLPPVMVDLLSSPIGPGRSLLKSTLAISSAAKDVQTYLKMIDGDPVRGAASLAALYLASFTGSSITQQGMQQAVKNTLQDFNIKNPPRELRDHLDRLDQLVKSGVSKEKIQNHIDTKIALAIAKLAKIKGQSKLRGNWDQLSLERIKPEDLVRAHLNKAIESTRIRNPAYEKLMDFAANPKIDSAGFKNLLRAFVPETETLQNLRSFFTQGGAKNYLEFIINLKTENLAALGAEATNTIKTIGHFLSNPKLAIKSLVDNNKYLKLVKLFNVKDIKSFATNWFQAGVAKGKEKLAYKILAKVGNTALQFARKALERVFATAAGKVVVGVATKLGITAAIQAIGQAIGSFAPIIGNIIAFVIATIVSPIIEKTIGVLYNTVNNILKEFNLSIEDFVKAFAIGGVVALLAGNVAVGVATGALFLGASLVIAGIVSVIFVIAGILLTIALSLPIVLAIFIFITTTSSFVVPPGGIPTGSLPPNFSGPCQANSAFSAFVPNPAITPLVSGQAKFQSQILPKLTADLTGVYSAASAATGLPCEIFAGIHWIEATNRPDASLRSGRRIGTVETDICNLSPRSLCLSVCPIPISLALPAGTGNYYFSSTAPDNSGQNNGGGCVFTNLLDSAIDSGRLLQQKVGNNLIDYRSLVKALSRYNGGGNANCLHNTPYSLVPGNCPLPSDGSWQGDDDPYPMNFLDNKHSAMYLIYCQDHTICSPFQRYTRVGSYATAYFFYLLLNPTLSTP